MKKYILLTFDIEEFDLPRNYGVEIKEKDIYSISKEGTEKLLNLLDKYGIRATFFITALFAKKYPRLIKRIGQNHEIALHGYAHSDVYDELSKKEIFIRLKEAKKILEKISGKRVISFRSQGLQKINYEVLDKIGMKVGSSIIPTYIPLSFTYTIGRFENLFKSRKVFSQNDIVIVPLTVTPFIRLPLIWVTFRNMPLIYAKICTTLTLINNNFVNLLFHPWEFVDITKLDIPLLMKNNTGNSFLKKIENYIKWAKRKGYKFSTIKDFLYENGLIKSS